MQAPRLSRDSRRQQILDSALPLFARHGFSGTTTKAIADAAGISEALLFKHFPTKSAVYSAILADVCDADPGLVQLRALPPSTGTLVLFVRGMVNRFLAAGGPCSDEPTQKLRLTLLSHLEDGEFAQILYDKVEQLVMPIFTQSLESAIAAGDAKSSQASSRNLFWLAHHTVCMLATTRMPKVPPLTYPPIAQLERETCEFILRGIGLTDASIAAHLDCASLQQLADLSTLESA
ncbi:MAG TPA: TetR/AcrR family transcriptional regulator [Methylovirgula sp.]|nr:TetR/AcrR family transcriptional regulator [Methylovirgula sp.]